MSTLLIPWLALSLGGGDGKLELLNVRATYGHLGAKRSAAGGIMPGDIAYFSFDIKNLKTDKSGQASYSIAVEVRDAKGELLYELKPQNFVARNFFGGNLLPCSSFLDIPPDAKPGVVAWKIIVKDRMSGAEASLDGQGKVMPKDFGLVQVGTFADAAGRVPVAPVGVVGGNLYVHFAAVGFGRDSKTKQPDLTASLRILDEQGKPTTSAPLKGQVKSDIPEQAKVIPMQFGLTMNREGRFTIEVTAQCQHCGKTATVTIPVRVLAAE